MNQSIGVVDWAATRDEWLAARRKGMGGSDISAVLGFSIYRSPWDVWAEKTNVKTWEDENNDAAILGVALEPWLREQAGDILGVPATEPEWRTYCHSSDFSERMCSPDGVFADGRILECKTAGLASGFGTPRGWEGGTIPLGYELQCRWSMHVMDAPAVELVALVAGMGLIHRTIERDMSIELDLVGQVGTWWAKHVLGGEEPPLGARDADMMQLLYPRTETEQVELSHTDALEHWGAYHAAHERAKRAEAEKAEAAANLKRLIGDAERGLIGEECIATWAERKGSVEWPRLVGELAEAANLPIPDVDEYRKPNSRYLDVKDLT